MAFNLEKKSRESSARSGVFLTNHGKINTPFFMPIATRGAVKSLTPDDLKYAGAQIVLSNTYHLWQRPGLKVLKKAGGLHGYMNWFGPILTDSGGYQVFSLSRSRKILKNGVEFISDTDGQKHLLTPEKSVEIQRIIGSDIIMSFDECPPYPSTKKYVTKSLELTSEWAEKGQKYFYKKFVKKKKSASRNNPKLFGIIQGSTFKDLRLRSARELVAMDFDGYAVGGLAVGEPIKKMYEVLKYTVPELPEDKPRYLMGVGKPEQIITAVKNGIDMFDCVIPTRNARHGTLYIWNNNSLRGNFYKEIRIKQSRFIDDMKPIDKSCSCYLCKNYSRSYLRHLFSCNDPLALRLASLHNVNFYLNLMERIRNWIKNGKI